MKVIITGASGLLGRSIFETISSSFPGNDVQGWAYTREKNGLIKVDIRDKGLVEKTIESFRPKFLIHCAAERRPDVAENDPVGTQKLNVEVTKHLTELSNRLDFKIIYICTDYVFDGNAPPEGYDVDSKPNPTNFYGKTKLEGEQKMLELGKIGQVVSLRVPVLYGRTEKNDESAINVLIDGVKRSIGGEKVKMDDWAIRYPTLVDDISKIILRIIQINKPLPKILHFSAKESFTKYGIALKFLKILREREGSSTTKTEDNIVRVYDPPKPENDDDGDSRPKTIRPKDCKLSNRSIEEFLEIRTDEFLVGFEDWWRSYLLS